MTDQEILKKLEDDTHYYGEFGRQFLSNSGIQHLNGNPLMFGVPLEPAPNLIKGGLFHQLILEPEKAELVPIVDCSTRNTKIYKDYVIKHKLDIAMLRSESDEMHSAKNAMLSNLDFYDEIRADGNQYEVPAIGNIHGLVWKGKADIICADKIIDLKTTSDISKFKWSARNYNYDSQCYIYQELFGKPLVFYVVEKVSNILGIFEPTPSFIDRGEEKVVQAVANWHKFFGPNPTADIDSYYIEEELF